MVARMPRRQPMPWVGLMQPSEARVAGVVEDHREAPLTYGAVAATRGDMPAGWDVADASVHLGSGEAAWRVGVLALRSWTQFDLGWVVPHRRDIPLAEGEMFGFASRQLGVWAINVCRIVYVDDRFGDDEAVLAFGYGTVGSHGVRGEERFEVRWDRQTDVVRFRIRRFSRPANLAFRVVGPLTRGVQRRFLSDALRRFEREVRG